MLGHQWVGGVVGGLWISAVVVVAMEDQVGVDGDAVPHQLPAGQRP